MEVWDVRVSCGPLKDTCELSDKKTFLRWALVPSGISERENLFCVRSAGKSMTPRIRPGQWCILYKDEVGAAGSRNGEIVLYRDCSKAGMERYTLKKYRSEVEQRPDGSWRHLRIRLYPLNEAEYELIDLSPGDEQNILGVFVDVVDDLVFPEHYHFEPVEYEPFITEA